jgi:non-canonical purine NTP pyrophosphatase (RdgB/HAM1 family)
MLTFFTSNKGKFFSLERSFKKELPHITLQQGNLALTEIQSMDIGEISAHKAKQAWNIHKKPLLVHDGGCYIPALNGFPGPYSAMAIETLGIEGYIRLMVGITDRSCEFKNVLTYIDPHGNIHQYPDNSGLIFKISTQAWPTDHPQQWSAMWRILESTLPTFGGEPLAAFSEEKLAAYHAGRYQNNPNYFPQLKAQLEKDFEL